jgi:hypothetical protein
MGNGDSKTPTWQWIAGIAMSGLMFFSSVMLLAALADIKEGKAVDAKMDLRVTTIEQTMPLQFEAIKEWREEIKQSLAQIAYNQRYNAARQTDKTDTIIKGQKSAAQTKAKTGITIFGK